MNVSSFDVFREAHFDRFTFFSLLYFYLYDKIYIVHVERSDCTVKQSTYHCMCVESDCVTVVR